MANIGFLQAIMDSRTYYFIEIRLSTIMIFSLAVKQTPHQVVTLRCQILICTCSFLIVKLKLYHFTALSAKICYLYKHRSNQIWDYMHRIKIKNHRGPFQLPATILDSILNFPFSCKFSR